MESLERRDLLAETFTWTGGAGNNLFNDPNNWDSTTGGFPDVNDDILLKNDATINFNVSSRAVDGFTVWDKTTTFNLNENHLTVREILNVLGVQIDYSPKLRMTGTVGDGDAGTLTVKDVYVDLGGELFVDSGRLAADTLRLHSQNGGSNMTVAGSVTINDALVVGEFETAQSSPATLLIHNGGKLEILSESELFVGAYYGEELPVADNVPAIVIVDGEGSSLVTGGLLVLALHDANAELTIKNGGSVHTNGAMIAADSFNAGVPTGGTAEVTVDQGSVWRNEATDENDNTIGASLEVGLLGRGKVTIHGELFTGRTTLTNSELVVSGNMSVDGNLEIGVGAFQELLADSIMTIIESDLVNGNVL